MRTAPLLVLLFQDLVISYNLPALGRSQSKQLVLREKLHGTRAITGRQDCQGAPLLASAICPWEVMSDAQTPAVDLILDNLASLTLFAYL